MAGPAADVGSVVAPARFAGSGRHPGYNLSAPRQQAEQTTAQALRDRDIQSALASAYASQLERLGDLPEQVRAALTPPAAPARTKAKPVRKARSG